jgi:flagellar hook protein FlgE
MGFQTGLSGLNASSKRLDVIGNNIANANTVGMKVSRVEFSELVSAAIGPSGGGEGIGVAVSAISQQFTQGSINITGNNLDVAINGGGFYQLTGADGTKAYTRDGQFKLTNKGDIVTNAGSNLMGFPTDLKGKITSTTVAKLSVPTGAPIAAKATGTLSASFNLDSRAAVGSTNANTALTVPIGTIGTTMTGYDSQGVPVPITLSFDKAAADSWDIYMPNPNYIKPTTANGLTTAPSDINSDGAANTEHVFIGNATFDTNGKLTTTTPSILAGSPTPPATAVTGIIPINLYSTNANIGTAGRFAATLDISGATQFGTAYAVSELTQDGYTAGNLTGVSISDTGQLVTTYSNGQTQVRGQLALADFRNVQGLAPAGGGTWTETITSGQPITGSPGEGNFGDLRAGATEESNVDLTAELINMMTAQRDYQANAQTIKTQDQVLSTLVNLR